jgi:hypothetical protein
MSITTGQSLLSAHPRVRQKACCSNSASAVSWTQRTCPQARGRVHSPELSVIAHFLTQVVTLLPSASVTDVQRWRLRSGQVSLLCVVNIVSG